MTSTTPNKQPPHSLKEWIADIYYQSIPFVTINLIWLPLTLLLVTAPPAAAGLYYATNELAKDNQADWGTFFDGFRKYFWLSWLWAIQMLAGHLFFLTNIWIYINLETEWAIFLLILSIGIEILWFSINLYSFPMLLAQEEKRIFQALRNSMVIVLRRPLATIKLITFIAMTLVISTLLPVLFVFITGSYIFYLCCRDTRTSFNLLLPPKETNT